MLLKNRLGLVCLLLLTKITLQAASLKDSVEKKMIYEYFYAVLKVILKQAPL